jgi:hypothetical protein
VASHVSTCKQAWSVWFSRLYTRIHIYIYIYIATRNQWMVRRSSSQHGLSALCKLFRGRLIHNWMTVQIVVLVSQATVVSVLMMDLPGSTVVSRRTVSSIISSVSQTMQLTDRMLLLLQVRAGIRGANQGREP